MAAQAVAAGPQNVMPLSDSTGAYRLLICRKAALSCYGGFASGKVGQEADYIARVNVMEKVLDFFQLGAPDLTVGNTIFEMWMGLWLSSELLSSRDQRVAFLLDSKP